MIVTTDHRWGTLTLNTAGGYSNCVPKARQSATASAVKAPRLSRVELYAARRHHPEARELLPRLGQYVPADGAIPVVGGAEGETLHLLDFAPEPGRPVRHLVDDAAVSTDLDRLENRQQTDGGWAADFTSNSEAAALEWRGYATVSAVAILRVNGR